MAKGTQSRKTQENILMRHGENQSNICCLILRDRTYSENYGGVAQLGEHLPCKQGVMGSNPIISTKGKDGDETLTKTKWAHSSGG